MGEKEYWIILKIALFLFLCKPEWGEVYIYYGVTCDTILSIAFKAAAPNMLK
jgi:hypothetical protein